MSRWSTSAWVIQESGYALGRGKNVILLIEEGADFPASTLDSDREWIGFRRGEVALISNGLIAMLSNLIADRLPVPPPIEALVATAPPVSPPEPAAQKPSLAHALDLLREGRWSDADTAFEIARREFADDPSLGSWLPFYYLARVNK